MNEHQQSFLAEERYRLILMQLADRGQCRTRELADAMHVSEMTIRRDFLEMERRGLIQRVHGGVVIRRESEAWQESADAPSAEEGLLAGTLPESLGTAAQTSPLTGDVIAIANAAVNFVAPRQVIYLDAGQSVRALAQVFQKNPSRIADCHIVTHSVDIAYHLIEYAASVQIIGGEIYRSNMGTFGQIALDQIARFRYDLYFMGAAGVTELSGWTNANHVETLLKQTVIERSQKIVALADSSKWGRHGFADITPFDRVDTWVCDQALPSAQLACARHGVHLLAANNLPQLEAV